MSFHTSLRVLIWDTYSKGTLLDELTGLFNVLQFSTGLHGGFKRCTISVPKPLDQIWLYLARENLVGRHFAHIEVLEEQYTVWEGRLMDVGFEMSAGNLSLELEAAGYWNSLRDQYYDAADAGNTDWTASGPHTIDDIIKEMLNDEGPDISTDQTNIEDPGLDVVGIVLTDRDYPQNIIATKLPMTNSSNAQFFFAIWEDRLPYLTERVTTTLHWVTTLSELTDLRLHQGAYGLRNTILPVKNAVEGTEASDADSQALYPKRELKVTVQEGVPTAAENLERGRALAEKKNPEQSQQFSITGKVYDTRADGSAIPRPKWRVRAGQVLRINDLVPASITAAYLDRLRTFYILETQYDAGSDRLVVTPDRFRRTLTNILPRASQVELDR